MQKINSVKTYERIYRATTIAEVRNLRLTGNFKKEKIRKSYFSNRVSYPMNSVPISASIHPIAANSVFRYRPPT